MQSRAIVIAVVLTLVVILAAIAWVALGFTGIQYPDPLRGSRGPEVTSGGDAPGTGENGNERTDVTFDAATADALPAPRRRDMTAIIARMFRDEDIERPVRFAAYRMGSAFLRPAADG